LFMAMVAEPGLCAFFFVIMPRILHHLVGYRIPSPAGQQETGYSSTPWQ